MRILIGALVLGLCVAGSSLRLQDWRTDRALFSAAVRTTPLFPQPALRLGAMYTQLGNWEAAATWTQRAAQLQANRPAQWKPFPGAVSFEESLRRQAWLIDTFYPICDRPDWARVCA